MEAANKSQTPLAHRIFVIKAMLIGGLVARRKALTKSTEYPVRPAGWISKRSTPLSERL